MEKQRLLQMLQQLHVDLAETEEVDAQTMEKLRGLTADIERILDERKESSPEEVEPVSSGLKDVLLKFEADHPKLSVSVGRVADALQAMGF